MTVSKPSIKAVLLDRLLQHQRDHPDLPVNLAEYARQLGVTRQAVHLWYQHLAHDYHLPYSISSAYYQSLSDRLRPQVKDLLEQGATYRQIAQRLHAPRATVARIGRDLKRSDGIIPNRRWVELREAVRRLRLEGLDNVAIARHLGISKKQVTHLLLPLLKTNEVPRLKRPARSADALAALDAQVKALREQGLTYPAIAEALQIDYFTVVNAMSRLRKRGVLAPSPTRLSVRDYQAFLARVEAMRMQGLSRSQIAKTLGVSYDRVHQAVKKVQQRTPR